MADAHKKFKYAIEVRGLPDTTPSSLVRQLRILLLTNKVEDFWLKLVETPGKKTRMCLITFRNEADAAYCARKFNNYKFSLERKNKPMLTTTITAKMIKKFDRSRSPGSAGIEVWNNSQGSGVYESDSLSKLDMEIEMLKRQRSVVEEERKLLMERKKIEMLMEYSQAPNLSDNSGYIESRQPFMQHNAEIPLQPLLPLPVNQDFIQHPLQERSVILNEPIMRDELRNRGRSPVNVQYANHREVDRHEPPQRIIYNVMNTEALKLVSPTHFGSINVNEPIMRDELRYRERSPVHRQYESHEYNVAASRSTNPQPVFNSHQFGSASENEPAPNETRRMDEISHARRDKPREYKDIHRLKPSPRASERLTPPMPPIISKAAFKSQQFGPTSEKEPILRDELRHRRRSPAKKFDSREYSKDFHGRQKLPEMVPRPAEYPVEVPSNNSRRSPARRNDSREYNIEIPRRQASPTHVVKRPVNEPVWELNQPHGPNSVKKPEVERDDLRYGKRSPARKHEYNRDDHGRQPSPRAVRGHNNHDIRKPIWETNNKYEHTSVRDPPVEREVRYRERSPANRRDTREYNKDIHRRQPSPRPVQRSTNEMRKPVWESNQLSDERDEFRYRERGNDSLEYNRDNDRRRSSPRAGQRPANREGNKPVWESNEQYRPNAGKETPVERGRERSPGSRQDLREYDRDVHRRQLSPRADPRPVNHEGIKPSWESNQKFGQTPIKEYRERSPPRRHDAREHNKDIPRRQPSPRALQISTNHETRKPVWEPNQPLGRPYENGPAVERGFGVRERMEGRRPRERVPDRVRELARPPIVNSLTSPNNAGTCKRKEKKKHRLAVTSRVIVMTMSAVMEKYATPHEMKKLPQVAQLAIASRLAVVKQDKYISCLDDIVALYRSAYPTYTDDAFVNELLNTMRTTAAAAWETKAKNFDDFCNQRMSARAEKPNLRTIITEPDAMDNYAYTMDNTWYMGDKMAWKGQNRGW